jgi:flagellar protein FlaG
MIAPIETIQPLVVFDEIKPELNKETRDLFDKYVKEASVSNKNSDAFAIKGEEHSAEKNKQANFNDLAKKIRSILNDDNLTVEFSLDKETKKMIMKVIDSDTKEVIKQYPPDITLKIARIVAGTLDQGQVTNAKV